MFQVVYKRSAVCMLVLLSEMFDTVHRLTLSKLYLDQRCRLFILRGSPEYFLPIPPDNASKFSLPNVMRFLLPSTLDSIQNFLFDYCQIG